MLRTSEKANASRTWLGRLLALRRYQKVSNSLYMSTPSISQLQRAIKISQQIQELEGELQSVLGGAWVSSGKSADEGVSKGRKKGGMSAAGRAKIAAAQKARWAKVKGEKTESVATEPKAKKNKRKMSAEGRARIVAAVKARWAKVKKVGN